MCSGRTDARRGNLGGCYAMGCVDAQSTPQRTTHPCGGGTGRVCTSNALHIFPCSNGCARVSLCLELTQVNHEGLEGTMPPSADPEGLQQKSRRVHLVPENAPGSHA